MALWGTEDAGARAAGAPGEALARVVAVNVGRVVVVDGSHPYRSAIAKAPVAGAVGVGPLGLEGDEQADRARHGGADRAVHAHFARHLAFWGAVRGRPVAPGAIGENLTLGRPGGADGMGGPEGDPSERTFCVGDVLEVGTARLQVTEPRVPCFKQARRLEIPDAVARAKAVGRTGFYLRVLREGAVSAGDAVVLAERPNPGVTVALANAFLHGAGGGPATREAREGLRRALAACAGLGGGLRAALG